MGENRASPFQRLENLRGELYEAFQKREGAFTVLLGLRFIDWHDIDLCAFAVLRSMSQVDPTVPMIGIARSFVYYSERTMFTYLTSKVASEIIVFIV
jgi:hypothetical protein